MIETKLCGNKALSDVNLAAIAGTLLGSSFSQTEVQAFLADLNGTNTIATAPNNTQSISRRISDLYPGLLDDWQANKNARPNSAGIRLDFQLLQTLDDLSHNTTVTANLPSAQLSRFLTSTNGYTGPCNTCPPPPAGSGTDGLPLFHVYLQTLGTFVSNYNGKPGLQDKYLTGEATASGFTNQSGAYHEMSHLNTQPASAVRSFEDLFSTITPQIPASQLLCGSCKSDVLRMDGTVVDYKSYKTVCPSDFDCKQFRQYLQRWTPTTQFLYILDKDKLPVATALANAKRAVKTLFASKAQEFFTINQAFFIANGIQDASVLKTRMNDSNFSLDESIFNFIRVE